MTLTQTYNGPCRLRFPDGIRELECLLVVEHGDLLPDYRGIFHGMSFRDARFAMARGVPLELELTDGRQSRVSITDRHGSFILLSDLT
jgi:hypothetical protein